MYRLMLALAMAVAFAAPVAVSAARKNALPPTPCTVQPRTEAEVAAIVAAATPTPGVDEGLDPDGLDPDGWASSPADLPRGESADPETVAAVTAAAREFAGCLNAGDVPRWLALMTDGSLPEAVEPDGVAALFEATGIPTPVEIVGPEIARVRVSNVRVLPDGRVGAVVVWGVTDNPDPKPSNEANFHIFQRVGDRWLLDEEIGGYVQGERGAASPSEAGAATPIPVPSAGGAPEGYSEIDSVLYAEPTMAGAKFSIEAIVFVGFVGDDDVRDATCYLFALERGTGGTTVSAFCRAEEALVGREAYLDVKAYDPRRGNESAVSFCEDAAPLVVDMVFSCTLEDPGLAS
jgi:hypothetical protein